MTEKITELPTEWSTVPMMSTRGMHGCAGFVLQLHSLKVGDWWLQILEDDSEPPSDYLMRDGAIIRDAGMPKRGNVAEWSITYKNIPAAHGASGLSLTKTKVMLQIIWEEIKNDPPEEIAPRGFGVIS